MFKYWYCNCGNKGWAVESLEKVKCKNCGNEVKTQEKMDVNKLTENEKFTLRLLEHARKVRESALK